MIKIIGVIAVSAGLLMIVLGVLGMVQIIQTGLSPWIFLLLGVIFTITGISILKNLKSGSSQ